MKIRVDVRTVNGDLYSSNVQKVNDGELEEIVNVLKNIKDLDNLNIETPNGWVYFNPMHVVSVKVVEFK